MSALSVSMVILALIGGLVASLFGGAVGGILTGGKALGNGLAARVRRAFEKADVYHRATGKAFR